MKFDATIVYHYLYGYQPMRLASQDEINSCNISATNNNHLQKPDGITFIQESKEEAMHSEEMKVPRKIRPPDGIALCASSIPGAKYGVCAVKDIQAGTWFGPFEGKLVRTNESIGGVLSEYMWECNNSNRIIASYHGGRMLILLWSTRAQEERHRDNRDNNQPFTIFHDGEVSHFLDGRDQNTWMPFVKCARHKKEQNMVVFQYHGCIYYRTTREIAPGSELLVWYDTKYTQLLGLPMAWNDTRSSNGKRKGYTNSQHEGVRKRRYVEAEHEERQLIKKERDFEKLQQLSPNSRKIHANERSLGPRRDISVDLKTTETAYKYLKRIGKNDTELAHTSVRPNSHGGVCPPLRSSPQIHRFLDRQGDTDVKTAAQACKNQVVVDRHAHWARMQLPDHSSHMPVQNHCHANFQRNPHHVIQSEHRRHHDINHTQQYHTTMTSSQVQDSHSRHFHHEMSPHFKVKREELCRFRDIKPSFRPIA